ncbi:MAG: hypothetical protein M1482_01055 [Chloroflexi bacterium]|nr:hypothetical protein [Chloroflexota bacterium]
MSLSEFLYSLEPRQALAIALGLSIALYALGANVSWTYRITRPGRLGRLADWVQSAWVARIAGEVVRWLYYLALPWGTLMLGYNSVRALGIWNLDWITSAFDLPILGIGAALVFIWIWRPYARAEHPHAVDSTGWNWARHIVEVLYQEAHWAFYRSGPILWMGDSYWGSFFGLALVFVEGWSNPAVRTAALDVSRADAPLWSGSIAVVSTIVFIFTQNSWYALSVHLLLDLGLRGLIGFPRVHVPGEIPSSD